MAIEWDGAPIRFYASESARMAYLFHDKRGNYSVKFRFGGREFTKSLHTQDATAAGLGAARVDDTLMRLKRGLLSMPPDADPGEYIVSGGSLTAKPVAPRPAKPERPPTLKELFDAYVASLPAGRKEANTLLTERIHRTHLMRVLGEDMHVEGVTLSEAQRYAARRSNEEFRGVPISGGTIRKELRTLRSVWAWGHSIGHLKAGPTWQLKDLHLGKDEGREPFRTMAEIERRIARGGLDDRAQGRLWECLYLTGTEVRECLTYAKEHATARFVYPMIAFCALTGARRSELCRSRIDDFDFEGRVVHIRERKRDKSKRETVRNVEMHGLLGEVMTEWFRDHPGGQHTLVQEDGRSVSIHLARDHFNRTLAGDDRWRKIPGFHTFRHSFASILASRGVDQRVIDAMMGHQTDEMRARYQHLFPQSRRRAIDELLT